MEYNLIWFTELPTIILQNQVPKGMKRSDTLMQMEAAVKKYTSEVFLTEDDLYDVEKRQPPRFVTQIKSQTSLVEMEATKFECQLAPVGDPNMKVEWFYNGKPLHHSKQIGLHAIPLESYNISFVHREPINADLRFWLCCHELWLGLPGG